MKTEVKTSPETKDIPLKTIMKPTSFRPMKSMAKIQSVKPSGVKARIVKAK